MQFHVMKSIFKAMAICFCSSNNLCSVNNIFRLNLFQFHKCWKGNLQANSPFSEIYLVMLLSLINYKYSFKLGLCTGF